MPTLKQCGIQQNTMTALNWVGMVILLWAVTLTVRAGDPATEKFITARDGRLFEGDREFRFLSFNIPNLLAIEDNVGFGTPNPWRLPNAFEIHDALATVRALGGTVVRTYVISVERTNDTPEIPRHVLAPGKFNEQAFQTLDEVLAAAGREHVRLIIPLVDNWPWMGGCAEYARWRGKPRAAFWTDPEIMADFKQTIRYVLTRTNTITGIRYADDPVVLCWETGNEVDSPAAWTREVAAYIKSLAPRQLVMDGFNTSTLRPESLEIPEVDVVTTHHYPGKPQSFAELIRANAKRAHGRKPYIVGEMGFASTAEMLAALDAVADSGASGGLLWSLRFRNRDGGFYWHSEPYGGNLCKAFHWPGSPLGAAYNESRLLTALRERAFAIRGLPVPPVSVPLPPQLLPSTNAAAIAWQGSVGATHYQVERAPEKSGPWQVIATNVDEAFTQYRPQFADETVPVGEWYYRVRAVNAAGSSEPSAPIGPVRVKSDTLVDELADWSRVVSHSEGWQGMNRDCRPAWEDAHRMAGGAGDALVYQLTSEVEQVRVFALFPKTISPVKIFVSADGQNFREVPVHAENNFQGAGDYGYWPPVLYQTESMVGGRFVRLELTGETQLGRVEIIHHALSL